MIDLTGIRYLAMRMISILVLMTIFLTFSVCAIADDDDDDGGHEENRPFFPSLMEVKDGRKLKSTDFTDPEECGNCHYEIYNQWNGSMHSYAFVDPIFQALWKLGNKETEGFTENLCSGCHTVIGVSTGEIGSGKLSEIAKKGVQCDVCHSIVGTNYIKTDVEQPHNATIILDPGDIKRGPFKDSKSDFHETEYSELHTKSELCGNCHNVFHPVSKFPIERTYDEWKFAIYAQNGIQCQDCHMVPVELAVETAKTLKKQKNPGTAVEDGPQREHIYTHEFIGGNFTVTALLGSEKHAELSKKRLKSAAKLDVTADTLRGGFGRVKVKVTNVAAGHNLPTSLTEIRQMWLDVTVTDKDGGRELFSTGKLDKDGNIQKDSVIFNSSAVDKDGHHTIKPWEIVRFEYNKTIPPKGYAKERFAFFIPDGVKNVTVQVKLRYRSFPQSVANMLLGEDAPVLPVVDMAVVNKDFEVGG
jgi:nitrate/TMAO reductase-like tetraheme cytochrome c subunit